MAARRMKILVWGINYAPEVTGIAPCNVALCEHLRAAGHDAHMLTTFAYYPGWQKRPEDRGRVYRTDAVNGVPVLLGSPKQVQTWCLLLAARGRRVADWALVDALWPALAVPSCWAACS